MKFINLIKTRKAIAAGALVLVGFGGGAAAMVMTSASADESTTGSERDGNGEKPLTGTTQEKVTAAVEAEYPGAEIERAETDSDGVYEAHVVTADGQELIVQVGKDFAITGTQTDDGHGDGHDDND
jgi:ABC-type glycerol-3-phosphate transport system substrate-binding protein